MTREKQRQLILEALGETSAVFMSQEVKGTEIVMPESELIKIADSLVEDLNGDKD